MSLKIEMGKKYQTRDGRAVRIICVDRIGKGLWPVIGLLKNGVDNSEHTFAWLANGRFNGEEDSSLDLIEVKPRITGQLWVNVYSNKSTQFIAHPSKFAAENCAGSGRTACIPITIDCEEGEGLDK